MMGHDPADPSVLVRNRRRIQVAAEVQREEEIAEDIPEPRLGDHGVIEMTDGIVEAIATSTKHSVIQ